MAQANDIQRTSNDQTGQHDQKAQHTKSTSKAETSPTFQQLLQREGSKWSHISTEKLKKNNGGHHNKKSVLEKVKEKAKKLKHSLSIKKHHHENDPPGTTSVTRVSTSDSKDKGREDAQFQSPTMSESKHIPNTNSQAGKDHHREAPTSACSSNTIHDTNSKNQAPSDKSLVADDIDDQVPSVAVAAADTDTNNQAAATTDDPKQDDLSGSHSRFSNLTVSTSSEGDRNTEDGENSKGESQKGVSVKEYLMQKLEPGEDERALSQIITQTISPRRDKVREAMSLFLKNEEPSESTSKISNSEVNSLDVDTNPGLKTKSKSLPTSVNTQSKIASIVQSHSLGSKASKNLNETFKSTFASYQNNLNSPTKPSSSPTSRNVLGVVEEENEQRILQAK